MNNTCKDANMVLEIQKLASHITQVIHAEPIFANYFYLGQVKNRQVPAAIIHKLVYQLFSPFINKKTGEEAKSCFDRFCESLPEQINLDGFKGQEHQTIISSMVNQHEAFMCKTMSNTFKKETFSTFFSLKLVTISGRSAGFRIKKNGSTIFSSHFKQFEA